MKIPEQGYKGFFLEKLGNFLEMSGILIKKYKETIRNVRKIRAGILVDTFDRNGTIFTSKIHKYIFVYLVELNYVSVPQT